MFDGRLSFHAIRLRELVLRVHLGCTHEERAKPQEVRISVELRFETAPQGTITDALEDTICYGKISDEIRKCCETREYQLIEKMGYDAYGTVRELTGEEVAIGISVHKVRPPIENLLGGAYFRCGDFVL